MNPAQIRAALQRALALIRSGELGGAETILLDLCKVVPQVAQVHIYLGVVAEAQQRGNDAVRHFEHAARLDPRDDEIRLRLAKLYLRGGQAQKAVGHLQVAVAASPGRAELWRLLGDSLLLEKCPNDAREALRRALSLSPTDVQALTALARAHHECGEPNEARMVLAQMRAQYPKRPEAYLTEAQLLIEGGDPLAAVAIYRRCLEDCGESFGVQQALAQALEDVGNRDEAESAYRAALRLKPASAHALGSLLALQGERADDELVTRAWSTLDCVDVHDASKALIGYGLGRVHQARRQYEHAFKAWQLANAARRREAGSFNRKAFSDRIDAMIHGFSPGFFVQRHGWGVDAEEPTFIVGMPRSGTTLVEQIISAHPQGHGLGELVDLPLIAAKLHRESGSRRPWPESAYGLKRAQVAGAAGQQLERLRARAPGTARRIVDKAPLNYIHLGLIAWLFPRGRVIYCERDPRDVCLSIYSENFALQQTHATDLSDLGYYYREHVRLMSHWFSALPIRIHRVCYENMVENPEREARRICEALELEWDAACLDFHRHNRAVLTPSRWQVRQPIYRSSIARWRHYEPWLEPLMASLQGR